MFVCLKCKKTWNNVNNLDRCPNCGDEHIQDVKVLTDLKHDATEETEEEMLDYYNKKYCQGHCCHDAKERIWNGLNDSKEFYFDCDDGLIGYKIIYCPWCGKKLRKEITELSEVL
jgi:DNA-directed RNA polymerase subunit RPC12/RpoP